MSLGHTPGEKWQFDAGVTEVFEDMLKRSIPQYQVMRKLVSDLALRFAPQSGYIIDLGCSRGESIYQLLPVVPDGCKFVGIDVSKSMLAVCRARFRLAIPTGRVILEDCDLRVKYPDYKAGVVLSVLTLQFTPIEYSHRILRRVYESLEKGGAFILVEKILGATADVDDLLVSLYYNLKGDNRYSNYEIERKRLSLEGVLVPVSARTNEENLRAAGFSQVDSFWRWCNFAGWIAIKE